MKKKMLIVGMFVIMFIISTFTAGYIKQNYARTIYHALKFAGVDSEKIIYQHEEKDHIDLFLADGENLKLMVIKVKEKKGRKNYEIILTNKLENLFSDDKVSITESEAIENQLEMVSSIKDTSFPFDKGIHKSFGNELFFIRATQNKDIKNLRIDGQKPTAIFTYNYKGIVNYVYYYEKLKLDHNEIKVRM